jgi:type II secretory pathway component PulF
LSNICVTYGGFLLGPLLAISFPLLFIYACWRFVGHSRQDLSRVGRLGMPLHRACILDALFLAADKGRPLEGATALLAAIYPRGFVRRRLASAHVLMGQGRDWIDSLRETSLLRANDVAALRLAREQNHLAWCLRELAAASRRRFLQRAQAFGQVALPFVLLGLGMAAAMIVIAMFMPLVSIINALT